MEKVQLEVRVLMGLNIGQGVRARPFALMDQRADRQIHHWVLVMALGP